MLIAVTHPNTPSLRLDLEANTICAVQQNMSAEKGLVRNVRVRITALRRRFIKVQIPQTCEVRYLPHITFAFDPARSNWMANRK
ncbi:uncharacterized protein HD556DRAFT_1395367 [Suillus plorans]|uniref:Uncharacterized protein n=1 Tax=Suillus plorans TaxID=116603 RepID=A0A9P7DE66_9AGAM|nr:uncharacterized protein HD556DRAFT_1395367 [Suillus plorans]KAG1789838.1 hypothetical protein HD556DRAFT_1395367 [Suillus plorans]